MLNNLNKKAGLIAMLAGLAASELTAQTLTNYVGSGGDVLICFRSSAKINDLVVDAGPVTSLTGMSANQTTNITAYTSTQLGQVVSNFKASWSAFTWTNGNTLFMSRPRSSLNQQTTPWLAANSFFQGFAVSDLSSIPLGASDVYNLSTPYNANSSPTAVLEPDQTYTVNSQGDITAYNADYQTGQSYLTTLNPAEDYLSFNFNGDFQGSPENTSSANGFPVRSDFYKIPPLGSGSVVYLGYFELESDGTMKYVAYPSAVPVIKSIVRSGSQTTITYTAGLYGTYKLRGTTSLTPATNPTNWPTAITITSGDNLVHTATDTDSTSIKFYTITAQ